MIRKFNYLSIKSFLISIFIVIFTVLALSAYTMVEQVVGLKFIIILSCFLFSILVNLETAMEENKNGSLYYLICKAVAFVWYICLSIIVYKYLLLSYEN
tara:strand:- start:608 stop:904 length:297 start_codon:yes stop_codon:yes gene_type:complete